MSELIDRTIEVAGLGDLIEARRAGGLSAEQLARLRSADLLVLGALADRVRADEVGAEVTIYTAEPPVDGLPRVTFPAPGAPGESVTGLELLREVAVARVAGAPRLRIRVDWAVCGLEIAQVALGFGADELVGRIANKRGLPLGEGELLGVGKKSRHEAADLVKRKELSELVRRAGRVPSFAGGNGVREGSAEAPRAMEENP
jgi:2-iminoacetate synthase ThiH